MQGNNEKLAIAISLAVFISFCQVGFPLSLSAAVLTDGTVGPRQTLSGPNYLIPATLGTVSGQNLFHSFSSFSIQQGESATFTGPASIANVISRVTGGTASTIDGLLRSQVGQADFYFINPAGVIFGSHAQVDVPASFHVGTADELRFAGGEFFSASIRDGSTLSMARPEEFGFLGSQAVRLEVNGSTLTFQPGSTVNFSGREVVLDGANVSASGGVLRLSAVGEDGGAVPLQGEISGQGGRLVLTHSLLNSSGDGGGMLRLDAGTLQLVDSRLLANNEGSLDGSGGVRLHAVVFSLSGGVIAADTQASADAGTVQIRAGSMSVDEGWISSDTWGTGNAGGIDVAVSGAVIMRSNGRISSDTYGRGDAGPVQIQAGSIQNDNSWISSDTMGSGNAGRIALMVDGLLEVVNHGLISSDTYLSGDAGAINLSAGGLRVDGRGNAGVFTGISSEALLGSSGLAGDIHVQTEAMELLNNGRISISNFGTLPQGRLADFRQGILHIEAGRVEVAGGAVLGALAAGNVPASAIELRVDDRLVVRSSGRISTETLTSDGGSITINGPGAVLLRDGVIGTSTQGGNGGNIVMSPGALAMDTGFIQANTAAGASGGNIYINVPYIITQEGIPAQVGSLERLRFVAGSGSNVIQAAAPGGEQGEINIIAPELDVSASLGILGARLLAPVNLGTDSCLTPYGGNESSLVIAGHGGMPLDPGQPTTVLFPRE